MQEYEEIKPAEESATDKAPECYPTATAGRSPDHRYDHHEEETNTIMVQFYLNLDKLTMMVMIYNDGDLNECERHGDEAETKVRDGEIGDEHIPDF